MSDRSRAGAAAAVVLTLLVGGALLQGCGESRTDIYSQGVISENDLASLPPAGQGGESAKAIRFGFDPRVSRQEDAKQYLPLLRYLESATGSSFELRFTPAGSSIAEELATGRVHLAAVGAGSFLEATTQAEVTPLVRGVTVEGRAEYRSAIVTAAGGPIGELSELRGKRFAFGDRTSTQGHLIPRIVLFQNGIAVGDLAGYEFTGSHRKVAEAVASGRAHAGGMQDTLAEELEEAGLIKIIHRSDYYPTSGIVAGSGLEPVAIAAIKRALLGFEPRGRHAEGLYNWDRTEMPGGFVASAAEDYAELEHWVRRLGVLELAGGAE